MIHIVNSVPSSDNKKNCEEPCIEYLKTIREISQIMLDELNGSGNHGLSVVPFRSATLVAEIFSKTILAVSQGWYRNLDRSHFLVDNRAFFSKRPVRVQRRLQHETRLHGFPAPLLSVPCEASAMLSDSPCFLGDPDPADTLQTIW